MSSTMEVTASFSSHSASLGCPQDWIYDGNEGCFYFDTKVQDRNLTWVAAMDACSAEGGFLAEIMTEDQSEILVAS